jgi:hypothetical protein
VKYYYVARRGSLPTFVEVRLLGNNGSLMKSLLGLYILVRLIVSSEMPQEHVRKGLGMRMGERGECFLGQESPFVYRP